MIRIPAPRHISLLAFAALVTACSSIDCPVENIVSCVYQVCSNDSVNASLPDTLTVSTQRMDGTDSVLLNRSVNTQTFALPISYTLDEDTLVFELKSSHFVSIDTVYVSKTNDPQFESVDCQIAYFHQIKGVRWTSNRIDSIAINKSSVDYDYSTPHLHIYFSEGF